MPCAAPCTRLPCDKRCPRDLGCGHRCPGVCGEDCLEGYCQACNTEKHDARVDLLEFKTYGEIDLDETPVVILGCGHFFTSESLDGLVGLDEVYTRNEVDKFDGLRDISGTMAHGVPTCPDCKCPIRQFATKRYNRVINRAVMDQTTKRFLMNGLGMLSSLDTKLKAAADKLDKTRNKLGRKIWAFFGISDLNERYRTVIRLEKEAKELRKSTDDQNQPSKRLFDAILTHQKSTGSLEDQTRQLDISAASTDVTRTPVFDKQVSLGAWMLQLTAQDIILRDKFATLETNSPWTEDEINNKPGRLAPEFLRECQKFIECATEQNLLRLVVQGTLCYVRIAARAESFDYRAADGAEVIGTDARSRAVIEHTNTARELLGEASDVCDRLPDAGELRVAVETMQKLFAGPIYETVTPEEIASIKLAMVSGPHAIATNSGHWYNCANGHPVG